MGPEPERPCTCTSDLSDRGTSAPGRKWMRQPLVTVVPSHRRSECGAHGQALQLNSLAGSTSALGQDVEMKEIGSTDWEALAT